MSAPPPLPKDYQRYAEDVPSSGNRPPSREDLDNYFDHQLPAPHRLSGHYLSPSGSPRGSMESFRGSASPQPAFGGAGPRYLSPLAASAATETEGAGLRHSNYSEMSMIGLNSTPGLQRKSTWLQKETQLKRKNHRLFIITCSTITLLIILGVTLGVVFGTRNSKGASTNDVSNGNNTNINTATAGVVEQGSDPSQFTKDPKLKQSFYGVAYTMMDALYPDCNEGLPSVIEDMQILSQLTTRIRLYGSDCNQTQLVLEAIKQTKVDLKVYAAIYVVVDDDTAYERQKASLKNAIETYGVDHLEGITVGNEFMLNYMTQYGGSSATPDGTIGLRASALLKAKITDTRQMLSDLGHPNVPVGCADAGSYFNNDLLGAIDFGLSNIHAWFAHTTAADAASWTNTFFQDTNVAPAALLANRPTMVIAETGWPTQSNGTAESNSGAGTGGEASVANLQTFLDSFICQANTARTPYFMFEYTDVPWKDIRYGGVEGFWGMFDKDKRLKTSLTLPDCTHQ
ncbi:glycoside hydrolase family 17 protein [Serendipita vermifera MAFF 305830]|uniref:glucan endo-1,3-beta-D-glucosidase n=1 Tax=Serendipita vermifera MAFF 305830 TaxID=933852 RepID=A0A0C2XEL5_SERVB|nr:glycoside hydrolase family 17 protein [Serendipita vermifera MAFF 305830]